MNQWYEPCRHAEELAAHLRRVVRNDRQNQYAPGLSNANRVYVFIDKRRGRSTLPATLLSEMNVGDLSLAASIYCCIRRPLSQMVPTQSPAHYTVIGAASIGFIHLGLVSQPRLPACMVGMGGSLMC
jgi:hypothetical protein